jgi:DNA-binding GntR family transcriptional regulator
MDAPTAIALIRSTSLATLAEGEVTRMIRAGTLVPGQQVKEADMARLLGVGRTAVREALRALEAAGMVRIEKNRGAFVRSIGEAEAREIHFLRGEIEAIAGALLAPRISEAQIAELRALAAHADGEPTRLRADMPDLAFHRRVVEFAGNGRLADIHRRLADELRLVSRVAPSEDDLPACAAAEHRSIVDALAARDAAAAASASRSHVAAAVRRRLATGTRGDG